MVIVVLFYTTIVVWKFLGENTLYKLTINRLAPFYNGFLNLRIRIYPMKIIGKKLIASILIQSAFSSIAALLKELMNSIIISTTSYIYNK